MQKTEITLKIYGGIKIKPVGNSVSKETCNVPFLIVNGKLNS